MARSAVGIYISASYVDIAELRGSLSAPYLVNFARQEIPAAQAQETEEDEQKRSEYRHDSVAIAVKEGLAKLKAEPRGVYSVLPPSDAMVRYFSMPQLPRSERDQAVGFEARKYIPFKINEIVSGFKILPTPKQKKTTEVFFVAATKKQFNSHLDIFKKAHTEAIGIDIVLFALIRMLLLENKIQARENAAVLYIDNDRNSASVHVINKAMPFLSRDFKISIDDKEALFEKLASELRVSLGYYHRQNPQAEVSKIIVCGESLFAGLDAFIADELKIITETLEQPRAVRGADKTSPSSIIAIGTALGGLGRSPYSINLSPIPLMMRKKKLAKIVLAESALAVFVVVATFILSDSRLKDTLANVKAIKEKGAGLPAETSELDIAALARLKEKGLDEIEFMCLMLNNRISWARKLDSIAKGIPEGVWIENLDGKDEFIEKKENGYPSKSKHSIHMSGSSFSLDSDKELDNINDFFRVLKEDPAFMRNLGNIDMGSIDRKEISSYWVTSFKIFASSAEKPPVERDGPAWRKR